MSKKTKVYIDTSVWNFALEAERPESFVTNDFLKHLKTNDDYTILISDLIKTEVNNAYELRKKQLEGLIEAFQTETVRLNDEALKLAETYVSESLIPSQHDADAMHIAIATVNYCDFLISWNYKHIVRAKTIRGVHLINSRKGYGLIELVTPREFLGK